jgi:hypothetical protein
MKLDAGKPYRAKTVLGTQITFTVIDKAKDGVWAHVDLDDSGAVEPNVWLNTALLLWVSTEQRRADAVAKAADEVIEALEDSVKVV